MGDLLADLSTRRGFFAGAVAAAASGLAARAGAEPSAVRADVDPGNLIFKLTQRLTFGANDFELSNARFMGYEGYFGFQLNHTAIEDSACDALLAPLASLTQQPWQLYTDNGFVNSTQVKYDLIHARVFRAFASRRQLFERVVEMWSDHFNVDVNTGVCVLFLVSFDRDVLRTKAMGTFPQLLEAVAQSPAMLHYLNNDISSMGQPNQNFARELLELHTMGSQGGYSQADVENVARCFTGWTIWPLNALPVDLRGTFQYRDELHDQGTKVVLGQTLPAGGGLQDGQRVLQILSSHPSTARHVAGKIARQFLGESVPASIIDEIAATYTATGGDIKAMIRTALRPNVLAWAPLKLKRPMHMFVSAMRSVPTTVSWVDGLRVELERAWNLPFSWGPPNGYPDTSDYWSGLMMPRWNFAFRVTSAAGNFFSYLGDVAGVVIDDQPVFLNASTPEELTARIDRYVFGREMKPDDRETIRAFLAAVPGRQRRREALGLAFALPSFQWY